VARDSGAQCKQCRREGTKLFLKGERCLTDKCGVERRNYPPGDHGRGRARQSEYRLQLREKQKARRYYGVLEKQFRNYYDKAGRQSGVTGENLIRHGHWAINGRRVNIPSYQLRPDDVITMKPNAPVEPVVRDATELTSVVPAWLQADHDGLTAKVLRLPERAEITTPVQEQLIVELYSK
jgi:small subunit ribosomal protein S4